MDTLAESEVTIQKLETVFKAAFMSCSIDKDGDLKVEDGGIKAFVKINAEQKVIYMYSIWGLKKRLFGQSKTMTFVNRLNNEFRLVRFCAPRANKLWCDYQLLYEGGVIPFQVVKSCRIFLQVCRGVAADDKDGLIA